MINFLILQSFSILISYIKLKYSVKKLDTSLLAI